MKKIALLILVCLLSGCYQYVRIPPELTKHCDTGRPTNISLDGAVDLANYRKDRLDDCNKQLDKIKAIQGTTIPQ